MGLLLRVLDQGVTLRLELTAALDVLVDILLEKEGSFSDSLAGLLLFLEQRGGLLDCLSGDSSFLPL